MKLQYKVLPAIFLAFLLIAAGCSNKDQGADPKKQDHKPAADINFDIVEAENVNVSRIFGIGYPGNDDALYIAANNGLKMHRDGKWFETTTDRHQYMGFQATESGFIASGRPQKGTDFEDPLGLVQTVDKGKTLEKLALYGKANFHFVGASYSGKGIYVINEKPDNELSQGVNYSTDNGKTWTKSEFKDFTADSLGMLAVHPSNGDVMAMSTRSGIYYSTDNGNTMKLITEPIMVTALTFMGDSILYAGVENEKIVLKTINPTTGEQTTPAIPFLDYDNPITYVSVNPGDAGKIVFATYKNDLYESTDGGKTWVNLLKDGKKELE